MSRVDAAAGMDRLPWLQDDPAPQVAPRRRMLVPAIAAVLLTGGAAFWFGAREIEQQPPVSTSPKTATVRLPSARPAAPAQPQVRIAPVPEVQPIVAPPTPVIEPTPRVIRTPPKTIATPHEPVESALAVEHPASKAPIAVARPQPVPLRPWQPRVVAGAAGRLVEVGAFGSVPQAKLGWRYMVRAYPAMTRLPAVVRPDRNSKGRIFYRFRVGTTSQAHSEVLCQRMQRIRLSCAVLDLPWKAKVER